MFKRYDVHQTSNPTCHRPVENLSKEDFQYYDKDGFELNAAERKFYAAMNHPIQHPILNHCCWQEPWFELVSNNLGLILDHSMFLCRCGYSGDALKQLEELRSVIPYADLLIRTRTKWGFDFALDAVRDGEVFEVLHVEYDSYNYDTFCNRMLNFDFTVRHTDWTNAADRVWAQRDQWQHLQGFAQNHWKSNFLLGWKQAEYTEKAI